VRVNLALKYDFRTSPFKAEIEAADAREERSQSHAFPLLVSLILGVFQ